MLRRIPLPILVAAILAAILIAPALAQNKVRTETIPVKPPAAAKPSSNAAKPDARKDLPVPEVISDLSRLPAPVERMRMRILEAARSGDPERVVTVMQSNELMPIFSFGSEKDPLAFWKANFPETEGVEVLGILLNILEAPFVHADRGTAQEMFIWPYFARYPAAKLTAEQKVELFRILTGTDWRDMQDFGAYVFYRVGIAPDGTWHFFVAGD